jgi:hypothetical protein
MKFPEVVNTMHFSLGTLLLSVMFTYTDAKDDA